MNKKDKKAYVNHMATVKYSVVRIIQKAEVTVVLSSSFLLLSPADCYYQACKIKSDVICETKQ